MDILLIILVVVLLFGGGLGYSRWGYGGGIGIGGILLIALIVYLLVGHSRVRSEGEPFRAASASAVVGCGTAFICRPPSTGTRFHELRCPGRRCGQIST